MLGQRSALVVTIVTAVGPGFHLLSKACHNSGEVSGGSGSNPHTQWCLQHESSFAPETH